MRLRNVSFGADQSIEADATFEDPGIYEQLGTIFGSSGRYNQYEGIPPPPRVDADFLPQPFTSYTSAAFNNDRHVYNFTLLNVRGEAELLTNNVGVNYNGDITSISPPSNFPTWGYVVKTLDERTSKFSTDYVSVLQVRIMSQDGAVLGDATSVEDMINNSSINLANCGGELIQFLSVTSLGSDLYEFRTFNRSLFGTDQFGVGHVAGSLFVLLAGPDGSLDSGSRFSVAYPLTYPSPNKYLQVVLPANYRAPYNPIFLAMSTNLRPFSVSDFRYSFAGSDLTCTWEHRTRLGAEWLDDESDAIAISETTESYTVYFFTDPDTFWEGEETSYVRKTVVGTRTITYTAAQQLADGVDLATDDLYVAVSQVGDHHHGKSGVFKILDRP
jgi:hypothetical protein